MNYKKESRKREVKIAKDISGKAHIGSGSFWFQKGDVSNYNILIEDKYTNDDKYSIQLSILDKLKKQALRETKIPVFTFGFKTGEKFISFTCIEESYIENLPLDPIFTIYVKGKSKGLCCEELYQYYLNSSGKMVGKLEFSSYSRTFFIFEYSQFIDSLSEILPIGETE